MVALLCFFLRLLASPFKGHCSFRQASRRSPHEIKSQPDNLTPKWGAVEKFTVAQIKVALDQSADNIAESALRLGCSRETWYQYLERYPELQEHRKSVVATMSRICAVAHEAAGSRGRRHRTLCCRRACRRVQSRRHATNGGADSGSTVTSRVRRTAAARASLFAKLAIFRCPKTGKRGPRKFATGKTFLGYSAPRLRGWFA
jgi:hypothetical protein